MEIPHVNRWTAWSCVLYTFAAIPPSPSLGLFIPFFSLNKGYPGLAAMQAFLLHCLSLQALRRGAVKRRKGLVGRKTHDGSYDGDLAKILEKGGFKIKALLIGGQEPNEESDLMGGKYGLQEQIQE